MDKAVQAWFNKYYGDCLGASAPVVTVGTEADEQRIREEYEYKFLKPMCYIATGTNDVPEDKSVLNKALTIIAAGPITDWIYLLNYWVDSGLYTYTGDVSAAYKTCVERTRKETFVSFVTVGKSYFDIAVHTVDKRVIDDLPFDVLFYPRNLKAHYKGRLLADLCNKRPTIMTAEEIAFISAAEARGFIQQHELTQETIMWPYNKGTEERPVNIDALTPNRPPVEYFDLCRNMAQAQLSQFPTQFLAVQDYAKTVSVPDVVRNFINIIATSTEDLQAGNVVAPAMDDQAVMDYLLERYGIQCTSLSDLTVTVPGAFSAALEITPDVLEGSAQDLLDAVNNSEIVEAATLDVLIENFCKNNNLSKQCTIEQLIQVINYDVHPQPATFVDMIATYMSENNAPVTTTFDDVIKGVAHVDADPIDTVLEFIATNELYSEDVKRTLRDSIIEGTEVSLPDRREVLLTALPMLGLPDDYVSRMIIAIQNNSPVELPELQPPTETRPALDDIGYKVGEGLLRGIRDKLSVDASRPVRTMYTPILYAFLRLVMCDPKSNMDDVIDTVQRYHDKAEGEAQRLLAVALDQLK